MAETDFDHRFVLDNASSPRHRLIKFEPTLNTGHLLQIVVIVAGIFTAYSALKEGQATQKVEVEAMKLKMADDREGFKEAIGEMRSDMKEMQRTLSDMSQQLARIGAQQGGKGRP